MTRNISASDFKARCLALLDQVARSRDELVVTKYGRPVAKVVPVDESPVRSTEDSVTLLADDDEAYFSTGEAWDADRGVVLRRRRRPGAPRE